MNPRTLGPLFTSIPSAWVAPYVVSMLLMFSPRKREPHGPNIIPNSIGL